MEKIKHKRITYFTDGKIIKIKKDDLQFYIKEEFEKDFLNPYGFIYLITNLENGKQYIGQTTQNPFLRFESHLRDGEKGKGFLLHKAISKYGRRSFIFEVLKNCKNQKQMNRYENYYMQKFNTLRKGYNIANVSEFGSNPMLNSSLYNLWISKYGEEIANLKLLEFKNKQRDIGKDKFKKGKILTFKNHKHSEESKTKLSENRKGLNNPMFNKNPYDCLVKKYGEQEAKRLWNEQYLRRKTTRILNNQNKKLEGLKEPLW